MIKRFNLKRCLTIISISIIISFIMEILASKLASPYIIEANTVEAIKSNYKAGLIYHTWEFLAQVLLFLGIGIAFWKTRLAPLCFTKSALSLGKTLDLYIGDVYRYNFHENFFFFNVIAWFIYTTFSWKFKDFKQWYILCILSHSILMCLYCSWPTITKLFR